MKETVQDLKFLKMGIEAKKKKSTSRGNSGNGKNLDKQTGTTDIEDMTGKINSLVKENV